MWERLLRSFLEASSARRFTMFGGVERWEYGTFPFHLLQAAVSCMEAKMAAGKGRKSCRERGGIKKWRSNDASKVNSFTKQLCVRS